MKRDLDLCRSILNIVEGQGYGTYSLDYDQFPEGVDYDAVSYNADLLLQAGLMQGSVMMDGTVVASGLTWAGHEFLDAARDNTVWNKAKGIVADKAGGLSFDVLKGVLIEMGKRAALSALT